MSSIYTLDLHDTLTLDSYDKGVEKVVVQRVHGGWIYSYFKQKFDKMDDDEIISSVFVPHRKTDFLECGMSREQEIALLMEVKFEAEMQAAKELYKQTYIKEHGQQLNTNERVNDFMHDLIKVKALSIYE